MISRDFEVVLKDNFDDYEMDLINNFLDTQETTDCEREDIIIGLDNLIIRVETKWDRPIMITIEREKAEEVKNDKDFRTK